jgi:hypothetical protein
MDDDTTGEEIRAHAVSCTVRLSVEGVEDVVLPAVVLEDTPGGDEHAFSAAGRTSRATSVETM